MKGADAEAWLSPDARELREAHKELVDARCEARRYGRRHVELTAEIVALRRELADVKAAIADVMAELARRA